MTFEEWWNEEGRGPTTKGEPEHFWAEKSWSASRQAAIEEANEKRDEITTTLCDLGTFLQELAASAMLAGETYPAEDRSHFYSEACKAMNHVAWLIDELVPPCPDCAAAAKHAYSDATTPGFFNPKCSKHQTVAEKRTPIIRRALARPDQPGRG